MQNIAIIRQGTGRYLFSVPENVTLKEGDRVKCDTMRGITDGIAFADSAWVDENISQLIGKLTGAKFPLKSVVGKMEYLPFEKPEVKPANKYEGMSNTQLTIEMCVKKGMCSAPNNPHRKNDCPLRGAGSCNITDANRADVIKYLLAEDAEAAPKPEDKQETMKLYCVKESNVPWVRDSLTKGKVYEFDGHFIEYDSGTSTRFNDFESWKRGDPNYAACLVPLVKRPAEVGEWVLLDRDDCFCKNKKGDVVKVISAGNSGMCFINDHTGEFPTGICVYFDSHYKYVLDGYHPEPEAEPEPEYWNGKVVCVEEDGFFTVGKVYEFRDGIIRSNTGNAYNAEEPIKSLDDLSDGTWEPKFIEYKGESND